MFTGLIQDMGQIEEIRRNAEGCLITIKTKLASEIKIDDSVATNGVCLTAIKTTKDSFTAQAVPVTLEKSNLGDLKKDHLVNLELSLRPIDRLGGHFVQGHVNGVGTITHIKRQEKTWEIMIKFNHELQKYMIPEGSVAIDGISLTIAALQPSLLTLAIIPHTLEKTTLHAKNVGDRVNIEVDMLAKYMENFYLNGKNQKSENFLQEIFKVKYES